MTLLMVLLTLAVVAGVAALVSGWVSGGLAEPVAQIPARALPPGPLTGHDVAALRFGQGLRGYRMDQVDAAMDGLAAEIERLRELLPDEVRDRDDRLRVDAGRTSGLDSAPPAPGPALSGSAPSAPAEVLASPDAGDAGLSGPSGPSRPSRPSGGA